MKADAFIAVYCDPDGSNIRYDMLLRYPFTTFTSGVSIGRTLEAIIKKLGELGKTNFRPEYNPIPNELAISV